MRIPARADYALRAVIELASQDGFRHSLTTEAIATAQDIPVAYLPDVLAALRRREILTSQRGAGGGFRLARDPATISLADVIRAVDGPLAIIGDFRPDELSYTGTAEPLKEVWIAMRSSLRSILETVSVADVASGALPDHIHRLTLAPGDWAAR